MVLTSVLTNISITPSLLLTFTCLSRFDPFPSFSQFCCWISSKNKNINSFGSSKIDNSNNDKEICEENEVINSSEEGVIDQKLKSKPKPSNSSDNLIVKDPVVLKKKTIWFYIAYYNTEYALLVAIVTLLITAPFLWKLIGIV